MSGYHAARTAIALVALAEPVADCHGAAPRPAAVTSAECLIEDASYPQCHASTILEPDENQARRARSRSVLIPMARRLRRIIEAGKSR